MTEGFIKLPRSLMKKGYYLKSEYVHLWVHLIFKAAYQEQEYVFKNELVKLKIGQFVTGRKKLSAETGISESNIERILELFEKCGEIEQQTTSRNRVITIVSKDWLEEVGQQKNNQRTAKEQPADTYKERKEIKKEKNNTPLAQPTLFPSPADPQDVFSLNTLSQETMPTPKEGESVEVMVWPTFDDFWIVYDKKVGRKAAELLWKKLSQSEKEKIMTHAPDYVKSTPDKKFRQNPKTYLNQKTYEDEIITKSESTNQLNGAAIMFEHFAAKNNSGVPANSEHNTG